MTRRRRIAVEILAPPALGTIWIAIYLCLNDRTFEYLLSIPTYLLFAYPLAILPSLAYAKVMEIWFSRGLHCQFGVLGTTILSVAFGAVTGGLLNLLLQFQISLTLCGSVVGMSLGFFVARKFHPGT